MRDICILLGALELCVGYASLPAIIIFLIRIGNAPAMVGALLLAAVFCVMTVVGMGVVMEAIEDDHSNERGARG